MTAPGGVIATVYVDVLPTVRDFSRQLRRQLRQSSRELRTIDRELAPVTRAIEAIGQTATGIVPGVRLARASLLTLGGHAVVGGLLSAAGAASTLAGAVGVLPAVGVGAASMLGTLAVGVRGVEDALKDFDDVEAFNEALEELSDNARDTLGVLNEFRGEIDDFRNAVQDRLFAGLDDVARDLVTTFLPLATTHFGNLADVVNLAARDLAAFALSAETIRDLGVITSNVEIAFQGLRLALVPTAVALRDVVTVGSTFLPLLSNEVVRLTTRFAGWISAMRQSGELEVRIAASIERFQQLGRIVTNVGRALSALFGAARESGDGFLTTLEDLTDQLADFLERPTTQNSIQEFLDNSRRAADAIQPVLAALADLLFMHVVPALTAVAERVGPAVARFFEGLGNALDTARPGIETFASGFAQFVDAIVPVLPVLGQLLGALGAMVGVLSGQLGPVIAEIVTAIASVLIPVVQLLTGVFLFLSPEVLKFIVVIGATIGIVAGLVTVIRGVLTVLGLFAGAFQVLATGALRTRGAVGGFVGFLQGPWGIALGIASIALGLFASSSDDSTASVDSLRQALENATESADETSRAWIRQQLEQEGAAATADRYGISINTLIDAYMGLGPAVDEVRGKVISQTDGTIRAADEEEKLLDLIESGPEIYNEATRGIDRKSEADQRGMTAAEQHAHALDQQRLALEELFDAVQRQQQQQLNSLNSELAYRTQLIQTTAEINNETRGIDINTQAGQDNLKALADLAAAGQRRVNDLIQQGASTHAVNIVLAQNRDAILNLLEPYFQSREAARQFAEQVGLIPRSPTVTPVFNDGKAREDVSNFGRYLDRVLHDRDIDVTVNEQFPGMVPNTPPGRQRGGMVPAGQWTWVGEDGAELVRFGRAARVFSNDESMGMAREVGELDTLTTRGDGGARGSTTTVGGGERAVTIDNRIDLQPTVRVYLGEHELTELVRVEVDRRDRQLQRLVVSNAGVRR